jgi:thiol-disulfide isomerase/thioredoxin
MAAILAHGWREISRAVQPARNLTPSGSRDLLLAKEKSVLQKSLAIAVALFAFAVSAEAVAADIGYDARANAFTQLDMAVARAAAEDKLVLLISGGDWCIWCHYLAEFLERNSELDAALHEVFVVAKVYVGEDNRNKDFFARLPEAAGAPHFWILSSSGQLLESQQTVVFEDGNKSYDRAAFAAFIARWRERAGQ